MGSSLFRVQVKRLINCRYDRRHYVQTELYVVNPCVVHYLKVQFCTGFNEVMKAVNISAVHFNVLFKVLKLSFKFK